MNRKTAAAVWAALLLAPGAAAAQGADAPGWYGSAGYARLTGTPLDSGGRQPEQGIGQAGNRRLRAALVELAWLWLRYQPDSTLAAWFRDRTRVACSRTRKVIIVALARKLFVALWRFCRDGVVPEGAAFKTAMA